eukprot:652143-Pyramimonas_sp.AAC.4
MAFATGVQGAEGAEDHGGPPEVPAHVQVLWAGQVGPGRQQAHVPQGRQGGVGGCVLCGGVPPPQVPLPPLPGRGRGPQQPPRHAPRGTTNHRHDFKELKTGVCSIRV